MKKKKKKTTTESHRGWRNVSRLEAHPSQSLGQLHCIHPTVRGHVRLTPNVHVHFAHYREEKGIHTQKGAKLTCTARENSSSQHDGGGAGAAQAEQCHLPIKLNLHSEQPLTFLSISVLCRSRKPGILKNNEFQIHFSPL